MLYVPQFEKKKRTHTHTQQNLFHEDTLTLRRTYILTVKRIKQIV